jgi:hypothetical protein
LRLGTLVPMNIKVPTKYLLSQDRIVVFEIRLHSKSPMLYRPALHGNWNVLSLARRALKDTFRTPTVPLTTVLQNCQVFLPDPVHWTTAALSLVRGLAHSVVCLTKDIQHLPNSVLHRVRANAASFNSHYLLFYLKPSSSCLRLLPSLPVFLSFLLSFFE